MKLLDIIDRIFAWPLHQLLRLLCTLTGKNNFFFAKVALEISSWLFAAYSVARIWIAPDFLSYITASAFCFLVLWKIFRYYRSLFERMEGQVFGEGEQPNFPLGKDEWYILRIQRIMYVIIGIVFTLILEPLWAKVLMSPSTFLLVVSLYFVTDFQPPKKSLARRALERIKAIRLPARRPSLAPRPIGT